MAYLIPTVEFCEQLFAGGELLVGHWSESDDASFADHESLIRRIDARVRIDAPAGAPELDVEAALWSLALLGWAATTFVQRLETNTDLPEELKQKEPSGKSVCHHWSVDFGLRYLAGLMTRIRAAAANDPLLDTLNCLASRWPYSSVGTGVEANNERLGLVLKDPCLKLMMVDRIMVREDHRRASNPILSDALARARFAEPRIVERSKS